MKKKCLHFALPFFVKVLFLFILLSTVSHSLLTAQVIQVFDFNGLTYNAGILGYDKAGIGSYHKSSTGGTVTFGNTSCFGYNVSVPMSNSLFILKSTGNVNYVIVNGMGTGSNRTLTKFETSPTLNGTYTNIPFTTSGLINSGVCGSITCTPNAVLTAGTFMRLTFSGNINITSLDINVVPTGTAPVVSTNAATPGKNTAVVNSTVNLGLPAPSMPLLSSGVIWSLSNTLVDVTLTTKTTNNPAITGTFNTTITGLIPGGTTYYTRTYAVALDGNIYYGAILPVITLPATKPTLNTNFVSNILSNKATSGGNTIDSGGLAILQKGVCWSTNPLPTASLTTRTIDGSNGNNYTSQLKNLTPNTPYYVRAFAINNVDTGYGVAESFTTSAPVPVLTAIPSTLNFGDVTYQSTPTVMYYTLYGSYLSPAAGSINITAPTGYKISTQSNTGFATTLPISYISSTIAGTKIYVQLATSAYGSYTGNVTQAGGSAAATDADVVSVSGNVVQDPAILTNSGTDFWTGFGYQSNMETSPSNSDAAKLSLYIAAGDADATVVIDIPNMTGISAAPYNFPRTITIPANTVKEITTFPDGDQSDAKNVAKLPDTRLYYTGVSNRGIHIYSTNGAPVSVWMYTYTKNNSAAGSMIFPSSTWNSSYTVQSYGGVSNSGDPNSFFFVIAQQDNTTIEFKPTNDIIDSSSATLFKDNHATPANVKYLKNQTYQLKLNKGEVFNAMGFLQGSGGNTANGLDLSGTTVKTTDCNKKIAVFGGNGRVLVATSTNLVDKGSDNLIQQMFPTVAWGTKYLTVPTKSMEFNVFRIYVKDLTTIVKVNGSTLPTSQLNTTGLYYAIEGNQPNIIESDKPVTVTQFVIAGSAPNAQNTTHPTIGNGGLGDPEMIILSPVQQAINKATVYSANFKNGNSGGSYINVIIKNEGIADFKLDNGAVADTGVSSYGTVGVPGIYASSAVIPINLAFKPHPGDPNYSYAKFKVTSGAPHTISSSSTFNAIAYGMSDGESYGYNAGTAIKNLSSIKIAENPYGSDTSTAVIKTCKNNPVKLRIALSYSPLLVDSILWQPTSLIDVLPQGVYRGKLDTIPSSSPVDSYAHYESTKIIDGRTFYIYASPVTYTFAAEGTFRIKTTAIGTFANECGGSEDNYIDIIVSHDDIIFTALPATCGSTNVTFTNSSTPMLGTTIQQYNWTFGDGTTFPASFSTPNPNPLPTPNPHAYPPLSSGVTSYWAKLETRNSVGCFNIDSVFIDLSFNLKAKFTVSNDTICPMTTVTFIDQSTANATEWNWDWNDGTPNTVVTGTSPTPAVTHTFYNNTNADITRNVKLFVKNAAGCSSAVVDTNIVVRAKPATNFTAPTGICLGGGLQFTNNSPTGSNYTYAWNFGDPTSSSNTSTAYNPTHVYNSAGPFTVTLTVTNTTTGCDSTLSTTLSSTIYPLPFANINLPAVPASACLRDTVSFQDGSTVPSGNITAWQWVFAAGDTSFVQNPTHPFFTTGNIIIKLKVTSNNGCVDDTTLSINIKPVPNITFNVTPSAYCLNASNVNLSSASIETTGMSGGVWTYSGTGVTGSSFSPSAAGTNGSPYTVTAIYKAPNGCSDTATKALTVVSLPVAGFTVSNTTCQGAPITFTDTSKPAGGIAQWEWNFDNGAGTQTFTNNNPINIIYPTAIAHNVTLVVTSNAANGSCKSSVTTVPVTVHSKPVVSFTLPTSICLPTGTAAFTNNSTVADDPNFGSYWLFDWPGTTASSIAKNPTYNYTIKQAYQVQLQIKSQYGCVDSLRQTLPASTIHDQTIASFTVTPAEVCLKSPIKFVNTTSGSILSSTWSLGNGDTIKTRDINSYVYPQAGNYTVSLVVVDANNCPTKPANGSAVVHSYPTVDAGPNLYIAKGFPTMLTPTVNGATTNTIYVWTPATYLSEDSMLNPICTPLSDQMYKITVTTPVTGGLGCSASDSMYVFMLKELVIPNVFSPNGDGINDRWIIGELNRYAGCTVEVFNRQGQKVFSSLSGYGVSWDGTTNGKPLPVGTYYYIIDPKNNHKIVSGSITILR